MSEPLTPEDYQVLFEMSKSSDPATRKAAQQAARKMTPQEGQQFFQFQQESNSKAGIGEGNRVDNSIGGVPPELAVTGGLGVAKGAITGASGGIKALAQEVRPYAEMYGIHKGGDALGVPRDVTNILMLARGLKGGRGPAAAGAGAAAAGRSGPAVNTTLPMTDAEYLAAAGRPRGAMPPLAGPPIERPYGGVSGQPSGQMPPNMTSRRSIQDLMEQTKRGMQNDFRGPVSFDQSAGAASRKLEPADPKFEAMMDSAAGAKGGVPRINPAGHGTFKEFPPGTSNKTNPADFKAAQAAEAEAAYGNEDALSKIKQILSQLLGQP